MTTLNDALIEIIQKTQSGIDAGVTFLSAQIPDVLHQLIMFNMVQTALSVVFGLLLLSTVVCYWVKFLYAEPKKDEIASHYYDFIETFWYDKTGTRSDLSLGIGLGFGSLISLFGLGFIFNNLGEFIKLWLAPKVWLIEYAAHLAK